LNEHGEIDAQDPQFDNSIRVLMVAALDDDKDEGEDLGVVAAEVGLPGGYYVRTPEEVYETFTIRVQGEAPLKVGLREDKPRLRTDYRAKRSNDLTGKGIRNRRVDGDGINDICDAERLAMGVLRRLGADLTDGLPGRKKKKQRVLIADALQSLALAIRSTGGDE